MSALPLRALLALVSATLALGPQTAPGGAGSHGPGSSFLSRACGFQADAQVRVGLASAGVPQASAPVVVLFAGRDGCVTTPVDVLSCQPARARISGRDVSAVRGTNQIQYAGTGADARPGFVAGTDFTLTCHRTRDVTGVLVVGAGVAILLAFGVRAELANRRRLRSA